MRLLCLIILSDVFAKFSYIFLAEISLFSTESYLSVNIENMNKEKKILKIRQLYFLCLKDNIYKFLNRTT